MLTYIIKNKSSSIFIIDEPDIYLHSDLQRQLLGILKSLGPDIIIATHSTELISEAELNDILVINKSLQSAKRIKNPSQLQDIFNVLGSNLNPILTQIAKSKRILFVEGKDFSIFSKLARKLKLDQVANRADFAVVPVDGFNPQKLKDFKSGIESTVGSKILSAVIFDRDYRSDYEVEGTLKELQKGNFFAHIHSCKELENFLIIPNSIKTAIHNRIEDYYERTNKRVLFEEDVNKLLLKVSDSFKNKVFAQLQSNRMKFEKMKVTSLDDSTITEQLLEEFDQQWSDLSERTRLIPGKEFLSHLNQYLQFNYSITLTNTNIINSILRDDFPSEMRLLLSKINEFREAPTYN